MLNNQKKSLIVGSILSTFLTYLPRVNAQTEEVVGAVGDALGLALGLIGGIFDVLLSNIKDNPILVKGMVIIFFGIFFYSELKELKPFKEKSGLAGLLSVIISIIIAYWFPKTLSDEMFSSNSLFMGFIGGAFILLLFKSDSRVSHAARGIAYTALMVSFARLSVIVSGIIQFIAAGFVIITLASMFYNFTKIGSGVGPTVGESWGWLKGLRKHKPSLPSGGRGGGQQSPSTGRVGEEKFDADKEARIKMDIAQLEFVKEALSKLLGQSKKLNLNIRPEGFDEKKLDVGLQIINIIHTSFEERMVKTYLYHFHHIGLDTVLSQFDAIFQSYRMKLIGLGTMLPENRIASLNEHRLAYESEARIITDLLNRMIHEITNLQRVLSQQNK